MMRLKYTLVALLVLQSFGLSQKRYVVNGNGDVLLVGKGQSASEVIRKFTSKAKAQTAATCPSSQLFGTPLAEHPQNAIFFFSHKDIIANWFEAPAAGVIDSVFLYTPGFSTDTVPGRNVLLRIHNSNLKTGHAPGWNPYLAPPYVCWGYYNSGFDLDAGIAAFSEDASDINWQSNYHNNNGSDIFPHLVALDDHFGDLADTSLSSFPVAGDEIWGSGGIEVPFLFDSVNGYSLDMFPPKPEVASGSAILISFTVPGANTPTGHPVGPHVDPIADPNHVIVTASSDGTLGGSASSGGSPDPVDRRTFHALKFYEHGSVCGPGWLVRGGYNFHIWYSMSVTSDVPPKFLSVSTLGSTADETHPRTVHADVEDCNFAPGGSAGVTGVTLQYSVDSGPYIDVPMTTSGGSTWQADIPAQSCGKSVTYKLTARDNNNNTTQSLLQRYDVLCIRSAWYATDTGATRTYHNSLSSDGGVVIDTAAFFSGRDFHLPETGNRLNKDDGTAGPFEIGNGFVFFGDTMRYAWVGVNGGIALSKSATDTINLNRNGGYDQFLFPCTVRKAYPDSVTTEGAPRNFIGGLWADMTFGDTSKWYGHIYHKDEPGRFIVEWDSLALFSFDSVVQGRSVFRIVLNKGDGILEFQYDNVTEEGLDSISQVGVQSDSNNVNQQHGYLQANLNALPLETRPRNNWALKLWPVTPIVVADGWNLLSLPGLSWTDVPSILFPHASSSAFTYAGGYKQAATLVPGDGFWFKYTGGPQTVFLPASLTSAISIPIIAKWNLIGSLTSPVVKTTLTTTPPGLINTSSIFGYSGGYSSSSPTMEPGRGYWVRSSANGFLNMSASGAAPKVQPAEDFSAMNEIEISVGAYHQKLFLTEEGTLKFDPDSYEMPPAMPGGFDARFASGRMVETFGTGDAQFDINIGGGQSPVAVRWAIKHTPDGRTFTMSDAENRKSFAKIILQGSGSVRIDNGAVRSLKIRSESGIAMPKIFALSQNYPNPFNPSTRMQLEIPRQSMVSVIVYDILGRKIATLVDGQTEAGYHVVEWSGKSNDGTAVPTGTYFVRMNSGDFTAVRKILFMK